jgi:hypothetical protein
MPTSMVKMIPTNISLTSSGQTLLESVRPTWKPKVLTS